MGFAKPIEQYLFGNLLIEIQVFMYLKDIIRGKYDMIIFKYEITGSEVYTVCTETLYFNM